MADVFQVFSVWTSMLSSADLEEELVKESKEEED